MTCACSGAASNVCVAVQCRNAAAAKRNFIAVMQTVDEQLAAEGGPLFLGEDVSLVDLVFAPFLERIVASMPYYKGFIVRGNGTFPNLERSAQAVSPLTPLSLVLTLHASCLCLCSPQTARSVHVHKNPLRGSCTHGLGSRR